MPNELGFVLIEYKVEDISKATNQSTSSIKGYQQIWFPYRTVEKEFKNEFQIIIINLQAYLSNIQTLTLQQSSHFTTFVWLRNVTTKTKIQCKKKFYHCLIVISCIKLLNQHIQLNCNVTNFISTGGQ